MNDIIDSVKAHYRRENMEDEFNAPSVLKYTDSIGNVRYRNQLMTSVDGVMVSFSEVRESYLRSGDTLNFEIEVDAAFDRSAYRVETAYQITGLKITATSHGCKGEITLTNQHVGEMFTFQVVVVSHETWHRYGKCDDSILVGYRVLPPMRA